MIEGVADDGAGHLWLTNDVTVLEIDEQTGVVRTRPLPEKRFNRVNATLLGRADRLVAQPKHGRASMP